MKNLYTSTNEFDKRAIKKFALSEEILMENAAIKIANFVRKRFKKGSKILGVCGSGNNAADVIAALRMLKGEYKTKLFLTSKSLKPLASFQLERAKKVGVKEAKNLKADVIIDGIFGSGLNRALDEKTINLIKKLNRQNGYKIACDIPSGLGVNGEILGACFRANTTIAMGGAKLCCYSDFAKDYVGEVKVANLGVSRIKFEKKAKNFLITKSDLELPLRKKQCVNKGDFGHVFVVGGAFFGAGELAAKAAFSIGAGLVSMINANPNKNYIIKADKIGEKMNAGVVGSGLNSDDTKALGFEILKDKRLVLDAAMCKSELTLKLLSVNKNIVLTPHPKEFCELLKLGGLVDIDVNELQRNRFGYARLWSEKFKGVLVLKGANTIVAKKGKIYICKHGSSALAKGGSGDVLAGLIAGLLAQGYKPLKAAINGVLAHALAVRKYKNSYSLNPNEIIKGVKWLQKR